VESFHAQLRSKLLDRGLSLGMEEVNPSLKEWREKTNFKRPHGSLGNLPPSVAAKRELALLPTASALVHADQ
jgi:putative transposase